uniref:Uncharacterized protein n=1 Tax=Pipistrellus kuhlii TaxID=59472 RepID=A0A7J7R834_PIPKU|nr:hypothetical protein mPipKuh1_010834 [Pipistrellus kuhlii]
MPACPLAQRGFGRCPGNGPFGTLAEPKDQIALTGDTHRLARDPKRLRGTPKRPPIRRAPSPPSVTSSPRGDGRPGHLPTLLCAPHSAALPGSLPSDLAPHSPPCPGVAVHLVSSPGFSPQPSPAGPLCPPCATSWRPPHAQNTLSPCHRRCPLCQRPCSPRFFPLTRCLRRGPVPGLRL